MGGLAVGELVHERRPEAPGLPVRLAPRLPVLAGRELLMADLAACLAPKVGRPGPQVAVLCGLGGAGKTSVAVEFAYRQLGEAGVCWQFQAEDPAVLTAQFAVLAAQLGARDLADARDPVAAVHAVLARMTARWLMVFDNVPDLAAVEPFLPPAGPGRVLITSQSQHWPGGWALQVPVLDLETAARFLATRTGNSDLNAVRELAGELGGLPLALEQAAAYMQATGATAGRYLSLFRARQADLLARGEAAGHRQHVAATLELALSRLGRDTPQAAGLTRLLAFMAPEPVPLQLLLTRADAAEDQGTAESAVLRTVLRDPVAAGDAVAELRRYSLATPAGDGLIQVHRLVQAVTRIQLSDEQAAKWRRAAAMLTEAAIPADGRMPGAWPVSGALLPHARALLDLTSNGMWQVARSLGYSGGYAAARDLCALIAEAHRDSRDYGPEHPRTLEAYDYLAFWTAHAGDAAAARSQYSALLPVNERVLGPEHHQTLVVRSNLARLAGRAGDAAGARSQFASLLPVYERVQGAEHPDTLTTRGDLARWTGETGDAAEARSQYAFLLRVCERVMGAEHPDTLTTRAYLAYWTGRAGDAAGARSHYASLLPVCERVMGAEHPSTLANRAQLAYWTGQAGDAAEARSQNASLLPVCERVLGAEHPSTLAIRAYLVLPGEAARNQVMGCTTVGMSFVIGMTYESCRPLSRQF